MPTRYLVSWTPTTKVVEACQKLGRREDDGTSFWDWIEPEACTETLEKATFSEAVFAAKALLKYDVFGEVRIEREVLVRDHDDLGNVFKSKSWERDATWNVHDRDAELVEAEPDLRLAA